MSAHDQDLLSEALRDRAGDMAGTHLGLDDVKGRARGIQRRRHAMGGAAVAVVLAIAVPVGLSVTDLTRSNEPLPTNPSPGLSDGPSPSVDSAEPEPAPTPTGPVTAVGADAARGEDPAISYLTGRELHQPDGTTVDLGRAYGEITPYAAGWLVASRGTTHVLDADGVVQESFPGQGVGVSSGGDWVVSQLEATGGTDLQLRAAAVDETPLSATVSNGGTVRVVGFAGDQQVAYTETVETPEGAETGIFVTDFLREPRRLDGLISARGANDASGVVAGMTSYDELEPGSCSAVVRAATGQQLWETCDFTLDRFSPDGRYVLGIDAYLDGIGGSTVVILDALDGTVLAEYTTRNVGFTGTAVWETDSTVLVSTYQDDTWYLLRLGPDGAVEQALDPVAGGDEMGNPWRFTARP